MDEDRQGSNDNAALIRGHIYSALLRTAALAVVLILIDLYLFGALTVPDNDMFPQIRAGDLAVYYKHCGLARKDAVIYKTHEGLKAGRIAAAPGDTVSRTDAGMLEINGILQTIQEREGIFYETEIRTARPDLPVKLEEDEYYVLGDNRSSAADSRTRGIVRSGDIEGVIFILIRRQGV